MAGSGRTAIAVGGATIDTVVVLDDQTVERINLKNALKSYLLLESGQKADSKLIAQFPGGGGLNSAVSLARLGFEVALVARIGADANGEAVLRCLQAEGVDTRYVRQMREQDTGASVLILAHDRNAAVFTHRGANGFLTSADIDPRALGRHLVYIAGLSNESALQFDAIVSCAAHADAFIAANPGSRQLKLRPTEFWMSISKLSLLSLNTEEASLLIPQLLSQQAFDRARLSGEARTPHLQSNYPFAGNPDLPVLCDVMRELVKIGVGTVVITDGERGAYAASGDRFYFCPPLPVEVHGTTGAGDAFSSTFAAYRADGEPVEDCLRLATLNASSVVQTPDAQSGLLDRSQLAAAASLYPELAVNSWAF